MRAYIGLLLADLAVLLRRLAGYCYPHDHALRTFHHSMCDLLKDAPHDYQGLMFREKREG